MPRQSHAAAGPLLVAPKRGGGGSILIPILLFLFIVGSVCAATCYVWQGSPGPAPPYTNWATAARVIQDAVDTAQPGDTVLVAGGVYATGGRAVGTNLQVNRVAIDRAITVESLMGPEVTIIQGAKAPGGGNGDGAIRCVYLADGASLSGFTLTNGATRNVLEYYTYRETGGGGVWCESTNAMVSNCILSGNSAEWGGGVLGGTLNHCTLTNNSASYGGGAASDVYTYEGILCTLNHCTLSGNSAGLGGGACGGMLSNCTLTGNSALEGGGAAGGWLVNCALSGNWAANSGGGVTATLFNWSFLDHCTLTANSAGIEGGGASGDAYGLCALSNCIVYYNQAPKGANHSLDLGFEGSSVDYCCTTPLPAGVGNITSAPLFVDFAGGNLRLQSNSPCINAGNNAYVTTATDLDGNPRIVGGTVDIGAYENTDGATANGVPWAWLLQYSLPTDGSADYADFDTDGHTTWQEWRCQTCPTNALSALRLLPASSDGTNVTVTWQSVAGVTYFLERSTHLSAGPPFALLTSNLPGQPGTTSYTDTNAAPLAPLFYRVGVNAL